MPSLKSFLSPLICGIVAVILISTFAISSILLVAGLRNAADFIVCAVWLLCHVFVSVISAITSGITVSLSITIASLIAAFTLPPAAVTSRVIVAGIIASTAIWFASLALYKLAELKIELEIAISVMTAAAMSVGGAAAWSVGVMSLIERETQQVGLKLTTILDAVRHNQYHVLRFLIKFHTGIKQKELDTALIYAVRVGYPQCVDILISNGANANAKDAHDNHTLLFACEAGHSEIVQYLLKAGAYVNTANGSRGTALHHASLWSYENCVDILLKHNADPNIVDSQGRTPLILTTAYPGITLNILKKLISAGSDVNITTYDGKSPLHFAAKNCSYYIESLLEEGANYDVIDSDSNTPLHFACSSGLIENVKLLLKAGCDPNALNLYRNSPHNLASLKGHLKIVIHLEKHNANPLQVGHHGDTSLSLAASNGYADVIIYFIQQNHPLISYYDNRRFVNIIDPLESAINGHHFVIVLLLLIAGSDSKPIISWLNKNIHDRTLEEIITKKPQVERKIFQIQKYLSNPLKLIYITRIKIRQILGLLIPSVTDKLPIPVIVKEFLMFSDLEDSISISNYICS